MAAEEMRFTEFRKLYQCVAKLIRCQYNLGGDDHKAIDKLEALARKMEVSHYIQKRDIIAVAGMQGTGKSTLIKNLYGLPDGCLAISEKRDETIPVFITEKEHLQPGQYEAHEIFYECGERSEAPIGADEVARKSRKGQAAYLELFVPHRCFHRDNASFVLLPGFEKNDDRLFKDDFNSLMDYTLHFAKAVILAVDDACIANEEIDVLIEKLGRNFNPNNCVFAITKTEGASAERCSQLRDSLRTACEAAGLKVGNGRIVCTGNFRDPKNNDPWIETLLDAAGDSIDYTAEKKDYIYFQPMLTEMWECAQQLQKQVELAQFKATSSSPIYEPLKKALEDADSHLEKALDEVCDSTKKEVSKQFAAAFDAVDAKHKKNKKWFFLEKKYAEIEQDRQVLERACMRCLTDTNSGKSVFVKKAGEMLNHGAERTRLLTAHDEQYEKCIGGRLAELNERQMQVVNGRARFFLDPEMDMDSIPRPPDVHQPELSAIANLIATEFEGFYIGMLGGDVRIDSVPLRVTSMGTIMREAKQTRRGTTAAAFLTMADLLDGKADILEGAVSLFVNDPAKVGAVVSAGCTAAAAAIAVVVAARKGIAVYNHQIRSQNAVGEAWRYALLNAVDEQKNDCLDSFREAGEKLLNYVEEVYRKRMNVGDEEIRIVEAQYAISDVFRLVNTINDGYAASLERR